MKSLNRQYRKSTSIVLDKMREAAQNSAYVIDKNGTVLMKYSKVHTCDFADEACLENGDEFHVCDFHGIKLGNSIPSALSGRNAGNTRHLKFFSFCSKTWYSSVSAGSSVVQTHATLDFSINSRGVKPPALIFSLHF